jgi:Fe-S cluster assembly protein SufD
MSLITEGQHGLKAHSDGPIPVQTRSERFKSTKHDEFAKVEGYESEWKLTPLDRIRDLLDDELDGSPFEVVGGEELSLDWVGRDDPRIGSAGIPEERAAANAWSSFEQALAITIPAGAEGEYSLVRRGFGPKPRAAHVVITAQAGSKAILILESTGNARLSENVEIVVEAGAELTFVSLQDWDDAAVHLASQFASVGRDARLNHFVITLGGSVVRVNPSAHLVAEGADAELYGLYFADAGQHLEQRVYVHHVAPHTRSRVTYKGALQGAGARTVWVGDVLIGPDASGTDTYEQNRNLVLTEGTRADSIPNLEIQTGDIVGAGHASATGRFDDEQLFYLQARGITEEEARRLVVFGFLAEIVQRIGSPTLVSRLNAAIEAELAGGMP